MSQQALLRKAFMVVLGYVPAKGTLVISDEERELVWLEIQKTVADPVWIRKNGVARTEDEIRRYTLGRAPTDLIQAYVIQRAVKPKEEVVVERVAPASKAAKMSPQEILALRQAGFSVEDIMKLCA